MSLINIFETPFNQKKLSPSSLILKMAIKRLKKKHKYHEEKYSNVLNFDDVLLTCEWAAKKLDKKRGNQNACIN